MHSAMDYSSSHSVPQLYYGTYSENRLMYNITFLQGTYIAVCWKKGLNSFIRGMEYLQFD